VSRGLGPTQWRALKVLEEYKNEGIPVREFKARMGTDRSNARRVIRGLMKRDFVEEIDPDGERRLRLTLRGRLRVAYPLTKKRPSPLAEYRRERREIMRALTEKRARREAEATEGPKWFRYEGRFTRRRYPGPMQRCVLAVLWEYADPVDEGLPLIAVKAIVGGDRSNTRRAIRTLLLRGEIEECEDGQRIRLAFGTALWFAILPPIPPEPIDGERARGILRAHQRSRVVT
jgi:DNA-binding MarR family transcriptional regulator